MSPIASPIAKPWASPMAKLIAKHARMGRIVSVKEPAPQPGDFFAVQRDDDVEQLERKSKDGKSRKGTDVFTKQVLGARNQLV